MHFPPSELASAAELIAAAAGSAVRRVSVGSAAAEDTAHGGEESCDSQALPPSPLHAFTVPPSGAAAPTAGQSWTPPSPDERCPSKWGADDEWGAANHMGPETVLKAARLIQTGRVIH